MEKQVSHIPAMPSVDFSKINTTEGYHFTDTEKAWAVSAVRRLSTLTNSCAAPDDFSRIIRTVRKAVAAGFCGRDRHGIHPLLHDLATACSLCERVSPDRSMTIAIIMSRLCRHGCMSSDIVNKEWGEDVGHLVDGLTKVAGLYDRGASASVDTENFRNLLFTFAQDIRVIIIMIVERLELMRTINHHPDQVFVREVAREAGYLYAPLAHRLGLYAIKSELEDMSLKYTNRDIYTKIARKLNETKASRDAYIAAFIAPVKKKLEQEGLKFDIKGRTKSIYSIWNKMKKQRVDLDHIYDLFAIRIILDTPLPKEKSECWLAYSLITDMYRPNPSRMKDWLSIPKSNGYESLHITVYGPDERWVEVQIRTKRMDLVAEKGLAAHWKYKGIKSENNLDAWMNNVRDILETAESGPMELMKNMRMDIYDKEVFVFTPKGDLYKLPFGATVLDFAFHIHSGLGCRTTGARVNGRNEKLNYRLSSGDTVEIMTSSTQTPKRDWLGMVVTSKARNKIRASIKERENRQAELGKELLERRFKNRKLEIDDSLLMKLIKKMGYKTVTDFYNDIASENTDINDVIGVLESLQENKAPEPTERVSAEEFALYKSPDPDGQTSDILIIGDNVKGLNYKMARCCNPIYGDDVFGFVSAEGVIKIHRADCPNARNIREKSPYRIIDTRWSGKIGTQFAATLNIVGNDDIGIVTNITSIINKHNNVSLRSINVNSQDGLFQGNVLVGISDTASLDNLIKKIKTVKGVKDVVRSK